jgi:hypothetical protein
MDVLLAAAEQSGSDTASEKRQLAAKLLERYQELVAACDSPRFSQEAVRLKEIMQKQISV